MNWQFLVALVAALLSQTIAWGHDAPKHQSASKAPVAAIEETAFGRTGDPGKATRTVRVDMSDKMRFDPASLSVRQGDTVRFLVTNSGKTLHEMVLGTKPDLQAHAELMKKHPGMEHDEPYMVHVQPGKTAQFVWQFTRAGEFHYGCLIPGHFEAGMTGMITVKRR